MHHLMPRWRDIFEVAEAAEAAERANATARRGGGGGGARVLLRNRAALRGEPQCFVHGNGNSMKVKANEPLWREMMAACRPDEAPRADESAPNGGAPGAKKARRERLAKTG